ncbi:hypothetical protein [Kutzneria sp. CA-103260]|uniref:hypothetical protein n=1 Tax=Kutzneria sp. CA-103260 TaxID=2802641 RepID=UPI001BABCEFB|nr:hypothetical protein [Kutzneria sp. CA-103260]QUQ67480.1 hypothetical protein JJ691_52150 [Kutzneria sp. CA-103260]
MLTKLLAQVDAQRTTQSSVNLSYAISEWMRVNEIEDTTRNTYVGYIDRTIVPALGLTPIRKVSARVLAEFYADLRRCRVRCDGRPFITHKTTDRHDCAEKERKAHVCRPLAAATVRQIHTIISGTMTAAVRWGWTDTNPASTAKQPKKKPPEPKPPSSSEAARLINEALRVDYQQGGCSYLESALLALRTTPQLPHVPSYYSRRTDKIRSSTGAGHRRSPGLIATCAIDAHDPGDRRSRTPQGLIALNGLAASSTLT